MMKNPGGASDARRNAVVLLAACSVYLMLIASCHGTEIDFCLQRGFSSSRLSCSSCGELQQFHLEPLSEACQKCCQQETDLSLSKKVYPYALLIVCECKFGRYPQIQAFVKSDKPKKFPGLEIRYAQGAEPIIKLLDENREVQETLGIEKWNTDAVEEFLIERLKS
jgi:hypothetical protein